AFPAPSSGESLASNMDCASLLPDQPVLLNVTVDSTSQVKGRITVRWTQPSVLPGPGPYEYVVLRAPGLSGANYVPLDTISNLSQVYFIDSTANTKDSTYHYAVKFYYNNGLSLKGTSDLLSSVRLTSVAGDGKVFLSWQVNSQFDYSWFRIYKYVNGTPVLVDSVAASGKSGKYTATGLVNKDTSCFFVETVGMYCDPGIPSPLLNRSETTCEVPRDSTAPCPPTLFIQSIDCTAPPVFKNELNWVNNPAITCNHDIMGYNLYYAEYEDETPSFFKFIPVNTFYTDIDSLSLAGCYEVTAINYYGVESARSNRVCMDNCSYYKLPNMFTPDGDLYNDQFKPFPVPRNVENVNFFVYNRWGKLIYHSSDNISLNWKGVSGDGDKMPDGIYYFLAEVKFYRRLRKEDERINIKDWVEIIRGDEPTGR
ncbi:MAG: gliding motility-associated C-terminal domain-containing protein, partial [Cytophagaceae bacterium]